MSSASHVDPFSFILLQIGLIVVLAMIGRKAAGWLKQPSVLGELAIGILVGNLFYWWGVPLCTLIMHSKETQDILALVWREGIPVERAAQKALSPEAFAPGGVGEKLVAILKGGNSTLSLLMGGALWLFSNLGVVFLLFLVGLESKVSELIRVGVRAASVAVVGVVIPFVLGMCVGYLLFPEMSLPAHLFIAATLCATSVGITARVFKDLNLLQSREAKIILGAAVLDDILGLIILAVIAGIVVTGEVSGGEVLRISLLSVLFIGTLVLFGERTMSRVVPFVARLDQDKSKLLFPVAFCALLAWIANQIELATIVGAFAAGLILSDDQFSKSSSTKQTLQELIAPIESIFAPMFFVLMGMQVNLLTFLDMTTVLSAIFLTAAAIIGKIVSGFAAGPSVDKLSVGLGMIPRGEVGLIFASIGRGLGVINDGLFSALVIMIVVSTIVAPISLNWSLRRQR